MQVIAIVFLCMAAAVVYGILHDQVTARICIEYFTIGHPPVFNTDDPTLLALGWGIIATWWVGVILGIPLALAAQLGSNPKRSARSLVRPLIILMAISAVCAAIAGTVGAILARSGVIVLLGDLAAAIPADKHVAFIADLWAHLTSYTIGFVGGIILIVQVWRSRFVMKSL
jgi:hypothetical protein